MSFFKKFKSLLRQIAIWVYKIITHAGAVNYRKEGVINLIDVGAIGELPDPWFDKARLVKNLLRFEPREGPSVHPNIISLDYALGGRNEVREFHIYRGNNSHGSSFYEPNVEFVDANFAKLKKAGSPKLAQTWHERAKLDKTIQVQCRTLDSVLEELQLDFTFDFLKIDAQGAEYDILSGSERFLTNHCLGLQLELFRYPMYKGIALKDEVVAFLKARGFELVKEFPPHGTFNCASDCIFLKKEVSPRQDIKKRLLRKIFGF